VLLSLPPPRLLNRVTSVTEPTVDTIVRCTRKRTNLWRNTGYFIVIVTPVMALATAYGTAPWMPLKVPEMSSLIYKWPSLDINVGTRTFVRCSTHSSRQYRNITVHMLLAISKLKEYFWDGCNNKACASFLDCVTILLCHIQGVPGGMWNTSGECSLC